MTIIASHRKQLANERKQSTFSHLQLTLGFRTVTVVKDPLPLCSAEACDQPELCPLNSVNAGTAVRIKRLSASPDVCNRLRELGFCEDQKVRVVSKQFNVICQVCHTRLGLSQQLAETILVEPLSKSLQLEMA